MWGDFQRPQTSSRYAFHVMFKVLSAGDSKQQNRQIFSSRSRPAWCCYSMLQPKLGNLNRLPTSPWFGDVSCFGPISKLCQQWLLAAGFQMSGGKLSCEASKLTSWCRIRESKINKPSKSSSSTRDDKVTRTPTTAQNSSGVCYTIINCLVIVICSNNNYWECSPTNYYFTMCNFPKKKVHEKIETRKHPNPRKSMLSIEESKKLPLLLWEDYRYLLSLWKVLRSLIHLQ